MPPNIRTEVSNLTNHDPFPPRMGVRQYRHSLLLRGKKVASPKLRNASATAPQARSASHSPAMPDCRQRGMRGSRWNRNVRNVRGVPDVVHLEDDPILGDGPPTSLCAQGLDAFRFYSAA